jgi:hypothetical protein
MKLKFLAVATLVLANVCAHADTVALWDYSTSSTKATYTANQGSFNTVGNIKVAATFPDGVTDKALGTDTYAAQGTGNLTQGVQFNIDTTGYTDLVFSFAQRNSATASAWTELQYTVDGSTWLMAKDFFMDPSNSTKFVSGLTFDFTGITTVENNTAFGVRLLTMFAPGTSAYAATGTGSNYGTAGTIRYDNVLLSGTAIPDGPVDPVPEPHTYALMLGGLLALGVVARRRRAN